VSVRRALTRCSCQSYIVMSQSCCAHGRAAAAIEIEKEKERVKTKVFLSDFYQEETRWRIDNARSYPTKPPADYSRCGASGPLAHVRVIARRRAAMDPAATRGLRTGRDAALPAVHLRHWPCQIMHVPLPSLP